MPGLGLPSMDTMDSQDGLKTIILPLFLNIFFYFHPADTLCDDFVWRNTGLWVVYPTCTHGRCWQHVPCWRHHLNPQDSGHAPSRLQVHIGVCKSLIQKHDWIRSLAPRLVSSSSASTSCPHPWTRTNGSSQHFSHTTSWSRDRNTGLSLSSASQFSITEALKTMLIVTFVKMGGVVMERASSIKKNSNRAAQPYY